MSVTVSIAKGFNVVIGGSPRQIVTPAKAVHSVSLLSKDYPGLVLKPAIEPGARVAAGQPILFDRGHPDLVVPSPVEGVVTTVVRGPHRRVEQVTIDIAGEGRQDATFEPTGQAGLRELLQRSGLWMGFRTRPFGVIPAPAAVPKAIFVTAIDTNPLAVDPAAAIKVLDESFARGADALGALTDGPVFVCQGPGPPLLHPARPQTRTVCFAGGYPAGLPSTHIHHLARIGRGSVVWHIGWQEVVAIGRLLATGELPTERIVAIGGPGARNPRLVTAVLGANLTDLVKDEIVDGRFRVVSGSPLHGCEGSWLGRFDTQVAILEGVPPEPDRPFLSRLLGIRPKTPPPIIPIPDLDHAAVADVPAVPLLRALSIGDTETASALGCLRLVEEDVALLSHLCTSRADYGPMLRAVLDELAAET